MVLGICVSLMEQRYFNILLMDTVAMVFLVFAFVILMPLVWLLDILFLDFVILCSKLARL